ncbi:MAG TPA: tRNA uridine-5-carboxymethylaminomethyl(34) synthesis GTPase MnmE [Candidatus Sulfotelmatobacter sp.]|jgi:tRNA modification GTPase|nr:tRNA uridine-5-carboxymethylaminomethyl(34) synthesis GTPase MnmE [Candidatus Sulfotelmatobacter sp.]
MDSIFALASAAGRAGVAVYRLSGPKVAETVRSLTGADLPPPRRAVFRSIFHKGELIDQGLVIWFPAPASFTGEDVAELQIHGGRAVAQALTEALRASGLRPAEPGEFSRRAFEAGKLDLTQAEAIADLVDAETAAQRRQALRQMDGALLRLYEDWRERLLRAQAHLEAEIDFSDEDLPGGLSEAARLSLQDMMAEMSLHLADGHRGERLRDGLHATILGSPNVGKSSLLNRIAGREAAIVSSQAGTTRDVIEVHLDLGGYPVVLADTAGLREAGEAVEEEGIRRARARAEAADLKLVVFDASQPVDAAVLELVDDQSLVLLNKSDLAAADFPLKGMAVSAKTGDGLDVLLAELARRAADVLEGSGAPALTRARHRAAIEDALENLRHALHAGLPELAAEDVRLASRALGRITGRVDVEDMLDIIFREFCIGK